MKFFKPAVILLTGMAFAFILLSCGLYNGKDRYADSEMYNFSKPTVLELPEALDEISGIAYYPKDTSVFAIIDEDGLLYKIPLKHPQDVKQWRFDKRRDYEDVVLIDSTFYVLVSNGDIETVRFKGDTIFAEINDYGHNKKKDNEFETLYYDKDEGKLVMICKSCEEDSKKTFTSFTFNFRDSVKDYRQYIQFDAKPIAEQMGEKRLNVKASAAAINPVDGDLYILSSINHFIAIFSKKGVFKKLYKLNPGLYKQAEGIAFTPNGDMIISNEQAETGFAELLLLKNKQKAR